MHRASFGPAQPVADWSGVKNLSHSGDMYFAGQPTVEGLDAAKERGVKVVVNLRSEREMKALEFDEAAQMKRLGMEYVNIPITPDTFGPEDADRLKNVLAKTSGPVLLHCGSSDRVGAVWAMYLNRHRGVALDEAIDQGRKAGMRSDRLVEIVKKSAS